MPWIRGVVSVSGKLTKSNCYKEITGRCSLDLISDFYISPTATLEENELLFCPRLQKLLQTSSMPLGVTPYDCGHVETEANPQTVCVAAKIGATLSLVSQGEPLSKSCAICAGEEANQWDIKALVKK